VDFLLQINKNKNLLLLSKNKLKDDQLLSLYLCQIFGFFEN